MNRPDVLFAAAALIWALHVAAPARAAQPDEAAVRQAVKTELGRDPAIDAAAIRVNYAHGIVTLSGTVNDIPARERAMRRAQTVDGVRGVIARLVVVPATRTANR